jgi:hypothetical protein
MKLARETHNFFYDYIVRSLLEKHMISAKMVLLAVGILGIFYIGHNYRHPRIICAF